MLELRAIDTALSVEKAAMLRTARAARREASLADNTSLGQSFGIFGGPSRAAWIKERYGGEESCSALWRMAASRVNNSAMMRRRDG